MTISVWRPAAECVDYARVRPPHPTVFTRVAPTAIVVQIFSAPNILVDVFIRVAEPFGEITLTIANPLVNCVTRSGGEQVPVAGVFARRDEFRGASIAQRKP